MVIDCLYDYAEDFYDGHARVVLEGRHVIIDKLANLVGEWNKDDSDYTPDFESDNSNYESDELDDMYKDAFEGDPSAQWNID